MTAAVLILIGAAIMPIASASMIGIAAAMAGTVIALLWWLIFSRAAWIDRLAAVALIALAIYAMRPLLDPSIAGGAMGFLPILSLPLFGFALVIWAVVTRAQSAGTKQIGRAHV